MKKPASFLQMCASGILFGTFEMTLKRTGFKYLERITSRHLHSGF